MLLVKRKFIGYNGGRRRRRREKVVERDKMVKLRCLKVENRTQDNNNSSNNNIQHSHQKVDNVVNICVFEFISLILWILRQSISLSLLLFLFLSHISSFFLLFFGLACILSSDSHLVWLLLVENFSFHVSHYSTSSYSICCIFCPLIRMLVSRTGIWFVMLI